MTQPPKLILARDALRLGTDRELHRRAASGSLTRLATGVFIPSKTWEKMLPDERYRTKVHAAASVSAPGTHFSHDSAAALWRLPSIGAWPPVVHELSARDTGGRSRAAITRHSLGLDPGATELEGVTVTSLSRTVIDMSCTTPFVRAVVMADAALRPAKGTTVGRTTTLELSEQLETLKPYRGSLKAQKVINFATGKSESPGESYSRVQFLALGYPPPELQVDFYDELGWIGRVDFFWRHLGLICEFDGLSKYGARRLYQRGLTLEQILMVEKKREDRLRRVSTDFVRLDFEKVENRRALAEYLRPHGLVELR